MKRKQKRHWVKFLLIFLAFEIVILFFLVGSKRVVETVTIEAGNGTPAVELFLKNTNQRAEFITDISTVPLNRPGVYDIEIKVGRRNYASSLQVVDTIVPKAEVQAIDLIEPRELQPEDFITNIEDATAVTVTYKTAPDMARLEKQAVVLVLTDMAGNRSEYETTLRISKAVETLQVEVGSEALPMTDFLKTGAKAENITLAGEGLNLNQIGRYPVRITMDGVVYSSAIEVVDTVEPAAIAVSQDGWLATPVEAGAFVKDIQDKTEVKVAYQKEPDFNKIGEQPVSLVLTDAAGNKTQLDSMLVIRLDVEPPKIFGAKKAMAYIGQPVSYKKGVYAEDNKDGEVGVTVDSSKVNLKVPGEYPVIYSAVDSSGNKNEMELTITVLEEAVTREELEKLVDEILAEIITEEMTLLEKLWAVYHYTNRHVLYTGVSDKSDWMKEAKNGIVKGVGDCFTYYAISEIMLDKLGVQALSVERASIGTETHHYWHMVNYEEQWYHFDACPHRPYFVSFMLTTAEVDAFSKRVGKNDYYYRYDKEKYPVSAEAPTEEILALRASD